METKEFVEDVALLRHCLGKLSILSETLQTRDTTLIVPSEQLQWTVNALIKIKDSLERKYSFDNVSEAPLFKGIQLQSFQFRKSYHSFDRKQFLQGLIDNLRSRMITHQESVFLEQFCNTVSSEMAIWRELSMVEREQKISQLCSRFNVPTIGIIRTFREFSNDP